MKTKSILIAAIATLGVFALPPNSAEAHDRDYRGDRHYRTYRNTGYVVVATPRRYNTNRVYRYNRPYRYYRGGYRSGPGISVGVRIN